MSLHTISNDDIGLALTQEEDVEKFEGSRPSYLPKSSQLLSTGRRKSKPTLIFAFIGVSFRVVIPLLLFEALLYFAENFFFAWRLARVLGAKRV